MAYIGQPPSGLYTTTNAKDTFSANGTALYSNGTDGDYHRFMGFMIA